MAAAASAPEPPHFAQPSLLARGFNRLFGWLVGIGLAPGYAYLVEVRGRKTGRLYSTPISVVRVAGKAFLVAPRGETQWVRNAEALGAVTLKRGRFRQEYALRKVPASERPPILKAYLDAYKSAVQRFFTVPAGSPAEAFAAVAADRPVLELISFDRPL